MGLSSMIKHRTLSLRIDCGMLIQRYLNIHYKVWTVSNGSWRQRVHNIPFSEIWTLYCLAACHIWGLIFTSLDTHDTFRLTIFTLGQLFWELLKTWLRQLVIMTWNDHAYDSVSFIRQLKCKLNASKPIKIYSEN